MRRLFPVTIIANFALIVLALIGCSKNPLGNGTKASSAFHPGYASAPPKVTGVSPATSSTLGGAILTISGSGFVSGTTVSIGGLACQSLTVVSASEMKCIVPGHAAGQVSLVVVNPNNESVSFGPAFTYIGVANPIAGFAATSGGGISKSISFRLRGTAGIVGNPVVAPGTTMSGKAGLQGVLTRSGQ